MRIDLSDYSRGARAYWWLIAVSGALAASFAIAGVVHLDGVRQLEVVVLMAVVYLAGFHPIRVPGTQSFITPGDIFVFLGALLLGAPAATVIGITDAFSASCRISQRWSSRLGGTALMAVSVYLSASLFAGEMRYIQARAWLGSVWLLAALLLFALAYFFLNTVLAAALQALKQRSSLVSLWWANFSWAGVTYVASASAAGTVYLAVKTYGIGSLLAAGPFVAVIFATCHFYFKQADERAKASESISRLHLATVEALATAIDAKDEVTHDHVYRVQVYSTGLARHFGLTTSEIDALKAGALLHDVGKIAVPDYILNKPGKLTAAEFEKMKVHTVVGAQILERVNFPYPVVPIVRHHHERWDGRGYPDGLRGEQIPMTARILTVVDCFDAIREDRQYRKGMSRDEACAFLGEHSGSQFDPDVVQAFLANLSQYEDEIAAHKASLQPLLPPTTQAGLSESARYAVPAAGLAQTPAEPPEYFKQIHASHAEVAALYEMVQTLGDSLDMRDVVTLTVNRIERIIPFTTCAVYLREPDDSCVAAYVFGQNAERIRGRRLGAGHGIAGWVVINSRAMFNTDPMLDLQDFLHGNETGYRVAAVYPLIAGDEAIGALALYASEIDSYSSDHLYLLESVSRLASTGIQHARLHEQTRLNAQTDSLTGLPNGRALYAQFGRVLTQAKSQGESLSVLSFNLAGMRALNDTFGYPTGDRMLVEAARRLFALVGKSGMLSRIAGDEFVCVLDGSASSEAEELGRRARVDIESIMLEARPGQFARVGLSYGIAEYPLNGRTIDELLLAAALATRQDKSAATVQLSEALQLPPSLTQNRRQASPDDDPVTNPLTRCA